MSHYTKTKGSIGELTIAADLMKQGFNISFPYGDCLRYDMIAEKNGQFIRIQCKYVTQKAGKIPLVGRSSNNWSDKIYDGTEVDVIAVYEPTTETIAYISIETITKNRSGWFSLRLDSPKNGQTHGIRYARDFRWLVPSTGIEPISASYKAAASPVML